MSVYRVYFFDAVTREELDHPLSGKSWLGTSGNVHRDGEFVRGTCTSLVVCDHSSLSHVKGEVRVTADDFDRSVLVKRWGPRSIEWRALVRDDGPVDLAVASWCEARSD